MVRQLHLALFAGLLAACAAPEDDASTTPKSALDVDAGRIHGDISFSNASGVIAPFLGSHAVAFPGEPYASAENTASAALRSEGPYYAPTAGGTSARYDLAVPLGAAADTQYRVQVRSLVFESTPGPPIGWLPFPDGMEPPSYRFGSAAAGATTIHLAVLEEVAGEAPGAELDLVECGAMVQVRVRFTGDDADLDALSASPGSIVCGVQAWTEDVPYSNNYVRQAVSDVVVTSLAVVRGEGALVPVMVRGDGSRMRLEVACVAQTAQPGFAQPPSLPDGWTAFGGSSTALVGDPVGCDEEVEVPVDVLVERTAGLVRGLFDVVGHDEAQGRVFVLNLPGYDVPSPTASAAELLDDADADDFWEFEAVPAGAYSLQAEAVLNGGSSTIHTPRTEGPNGPVTVEAGETTDLRARFVAAPHRVTGGMRILDPLESDVDMRLFSNPPFNSVNRHLHSHVDAAGDEALSLLPGSASGIGGVARGLLAGGFDTATRVAELEYEVLLTGLSPIAGGVDGLDAAPTAWELWRIVLYLSGESVAMPGNDVYQRIDLTPVYHLGVDAVPGGETELPTLEVCMGHATLKLQLAPGLGEMYLPRFTIESSAVTPPTYVETPGYSSVRWGEVRGVPSQSGSAETEGMVEALLPEGIQYTVNPKLELVAPGGAVTTMEIEPMQLPASGPVACGKATVDCATVLQGGDLVITSPSVQPVVLCEDDTELVISVVGSAEITEITYELEHEDGTTTGPVVVCSGGCGVAPTQIVAVDLTGVAEVRVRVVDEYGCDPEVVATVDPSTPAIDCPGEPIVVQLEPGELDLPADDPRIADELAAVGVVGACSTPPAVANDAPGTFPVGDTLVTFTADGVAPCQSIVRVVLPAQLAYLVDGEARLHRIGGEVELAHAPVEPALAIDFDRDGAYLAVAGVGPFVALLDPDTGEDVAQQLGFASIGGGQARSVDVRNDGSAALALGLQQTLRLAGVGLGGVHDVPGVLTLVDFSDDGERLIALALVPGMLQAYAVDVAGDQVPEWLGEHPILDSPLGMRHVSTTDTNTVFQLATRAGLFNYVYDPNFVPEDEEGEEWQPQAVTIGKVEHQPFHRVDFSEQTPDGIAASWQDGTVGILHAGVDEDGQEVLVRSLVDAPLGYYEVSFSLEHRLLAIAARPPEDPAEPESRIEIYRWTLEGDALAFELIQTIPVSGATSLTFRPGAH